MKILLVEDENLIAQSIKKGLQQESYTVDVSSDGNNGLDLSLSGDYELIILDLMLPGLDGISICQQVRQANIQTPILMLTAKDRVIDRVNGLNSGADDYLTKPFSFEELLARVRALGRRPSNTLGNILKVADLTLNPDTFVVERSRKEIALSRKEFLLLEYFMRHPGNILTKNQIINHVWNYDSDILPNTVEAYIGYLRNKIKLPGDKTSLIQTVRGFGYKLN